MPHLKSFCLINIRKSIFDVKRLTFQPYYRYRSIDKKQPHYLNRLSVFSITLCPWFSKLLFYEDFYIEFYIVYIAQYSIYLIVTYLTLYLNLPWTLKRVNARRWPSLAMIRGKIMSTFNNLIIYADFVKCKCQFLGK